MNPGPLYKKTRFAPTPSGFLHLGNIYSFALTAALAAKSGAHIMLRIDDADRERTNKLYVQDIIDTLRYLQLPWNEGPRTVDEFDREYTQALRMPLYTAALQQLRASGALFACTCTRTDLLRLSPDSIYTGTCRNKHIPLDAPNVSWRIRTDAAKELTVHTWGGKAIKTTMPASMTDFMVRKKDGLPAYQLTSLIDDMHFGVDLVVRGDDLWPSTVAQLFLASYIAHSTFAATAFYHHPLLMNSEGHKLSKSAGATSVHYLRQNGKTPEDIYGLLGQLCGVGGVVRNWQELVPQI